MCRWGISQAHVMPLTISSQCYRGDLLGHITLQIHHDPGFQHTPQLKFHCVEIPLLQHLNFGFLYSYQLTNDELQTPGHISMELISAPPTSADHTVFMTSLKESHAGDHMTSRRDDTRLKSEHMIFTDALDENASPNPQPSLTMVILQLHCSCLILYS